MIGCYIKIIGSYIDMIGYYKKNAKMEYDIYVEVVRFRHGPSVCKLGRRFSVTNTHRDTFNYKKSSLKYGSHSGNP